MKYDDGSNEWNNQVNNNLIDGIEDCSLFDDMDYQEDINIDYDINKNNFNEKDISISDDTKDTEVFVDTKDVDNGNIENLADKKDYLNLTDVIFSDDDETIQIKENRQEDTIEEQEFLREVTYTQVENVEEEILEKNNQQKDNEDISTNEIYPQEDTKETLDPKIENLKQQEIWAKEMEDSTESETKEEKINLSDFPIEKKEETQEDNTLNIEREEKEVDIPIISPEIAVDVERKIAKEIIEKPRNYKELISTNGEVLGNYIFGNCKFNNMSDTFGVCIELCKLFLKVNSLGYHFNGVTADDILVTPQKTCKLVNADKLVSQNSDYEINYTKTCAPEILRKEVKPNQYTDRYTLAFILFGLLFKSDPFEGRQMLESVFYTKEEELKYYENPVFVYNNRDKSNEPVSGIHSVLIKYWNRYYSGKIKMAFMQSFIDGIINAESRVEEDSFIEIFKELKYIVDSKDGKSNDINITQKVTKDEKNAKSSVDEGNTESENNVISDKQTQKVSTEPKANYQLCIKSYYVYESQAVTEVIDLIPGTEIPNSIVGYDDVLTTNIIGKVIQNAKHKDVIGIKNLSKHKWIASIGGNIKEFEPGKVLVIKKGVEIDFYPENKSESKSKWSIR